MLRVVAFAPQHLEQAAALVSELGYVVPSPQQFRDRLTRLVHGEQCVYVAEWPDGTGNRAAPIVAGWLHVVGVRRLDSDGYAEVLTLVVSRASRRRGVGQALIGAARQWALDAGFNRLRLRSGLHRAEAHAFYAALGFEIARPGHTFQCLL